MITGRKKRLRIIQLTLFILGLSIIIYTYKISENTNDQIVIKQSAQELNKELAKYGENIDFFVNACKKGPLFANVENIQKREENFKKFKNFSIYY